MSWPVSSSRPSVQRRQPEPARAGIDRVARRGVPVAHAEAARGEEPRVPAVEVVHRREEVAEALADRALLGDLAGSEAGHDRVLHGVAVLVHDDLAVLGIVDAAVAEAHRLVGRHVLRLVLGEAVHLRSDRIVGLVDAERADVAADAVHRGVGGRLLEAVVAARIAVDATRLAREPRRVRQGAPRQVRDDVDVGARELRAALRQALQRHEHARRVETVLVASPLSRRLVLAVAWIGLGS